MTKKYKYIHVRLFIVTTEWNNVSLSRPEPVAVLLGWGGASRRSDRGPGPRAPENRHWH